MFEFCYILEQLVTLCLWKVYGCEDMYDYPRVNHPANEIKIKENKNMIFLLRHGTQDIKLYQLYNFHQFQIQLNISDVLSPGTGNLRIIIMRYSFYTA